jgi:hypothetical protein
MRITNIVAPSLYVPTRGSKAICPEMNRAEILEKISKALSLLTYQTGIENRTGFYSKNKLIEDLLLPMFQILLRASHLRNLNQGRVNFPYIDLGDDRARLAVQVTTERSAEKVTKTLRQFISHNYQKRFKRLVFFLLTPRKTNFSAISKRKWRRICGRKLRFNPEADIITTLDLFPLIAHLPHSKILLLHDIIGQSIVGEAYIDIEGVLNDLSLRQIEYERKTGKYIPDIFVETRGSKNLARSFANPVLFFERTVESLSRLDIPGWNHFLDKAGLPPLPFPTLRGYAASHALNDTSKSAIELSLKLGDITSVLKTYHDFSHSEPLPVAVKEDRRYFFKENTFTLKSALGWGLNRQLEDLLDELAATKARVFILTGRAGQGKTNLVCDFVERFLLKHKVPCAYLSVRRLRSRQGADLGDVIQRILFDGKTATFAEAAKLLSAHAGRVEKPFVLIIDGLNEHHRISEFAEQLELFVEDLTRYPNLKVFLTCRSEYFRERFGNLVRTPLLEHVFLVEANENRLDEDVYDEMVRGYFNFFEIRRDMVSDRVIEVLTKDMLLLRFFCEAYGARGKPAGHRQEFLASIYREQIFEIYLDRKLGMATAFLQRLCDKPSPTDEKADLASVLEHCVAHMFRTWNFADVPLSAIPTNLHNALYALLDEELVLRRDVSKGASIFAEPSETINFTFDEFRDFLLAQYLLRRVYVSDRATFEQYIAKSDPKGSQVIEGLKRFLFYASRKEENEQFWRFFKDQPWYNDVYDSEVFNIDTKLLRPEDRDLVTRALEVGDQRAISFAVRLALNWDATYRKVLNLDLLLSFVIGSDNLRFDALIMPAFTTVPNYNEGVSAKGFCKFVAEHILPAFDSVPQPAKDSLFRFLILLLPVDSGVDLNSQSFFILRNVLDKYPKYGINLLRDSLGWRPTRHRPYVWRLLTSESILPSLVEPLRGRAETERSQADGTDPVLYREAERFLRRLSARMDTSNQ